MPEAAPEPDEGEGLGEGLDGVVTSPPLTALPPLSVGTWEVPLVPDEPPLPEESVEPPVVGESEDPVPPVAPEALGFEVPPPLSSEGSTAPPEPGLGVEGDALGDGEGEEGWAAAAEGEKLATGDGEGEGAKSTTGACPPPGSDGAAGAEGPG